MRLLLSCGLAIIWPFFTFAQNTFGNSADQNGSAESQKELDQTILSLNHAIEQNPKNPVDYYKRGLAEFQRGKLITLSNDADHSPTREEMEAFKQYRQYMSAAIADFSKAIELNPVYGDAYLHRGLVELEHRSGDITIIHRAKPDILKAVELEPKNPEVFRALAQTESDREQAIQDYTKAIEVAPLDAWTYWNRARIEGWAGHYENASKDFAKAIQLNPTEIEFYHARADMEVMLAGTGQNDWNSPILI